MNCVNRDIFGPIVSHLLLLEAETTARVTRTWLQNEGQRPSTGVAVGSLIVVELINETICVVTKPKHKIVEAREVLERECLLMVSLTSSGICFPPREPIANPPRTGHPIPSI
jgi:hypothetical protein